MILIEKLEDRFKGTWLGKPIAYLRRNSQPLINIYLGINVVGWVGWQIYQAYRQGRLDYIEISFALQNLVMLVFILIRRTHRGIDRQWTHQAVAVIAFFSGLAFMGQAASSNPVLLSYSRGVTMAANVLGILTLLNLGRSFGILIALRQVKSKGLYAIVRHPMYGTDILLRIGFIISHFNIFTVVVFVLSSGCYVYRALLEERFLSQDEAYRQYQQKVRWRFIPLFF